MDKLNVEEFRALMKASGNKVSKKGRPIIDVGSIYGDKPNRKVRNATKVYNEAGEKIADSKLEYRVMMALQNRGIAFEFQRKFVMLDTLRREGKKTLRALTWTPDFVFEDVQVVADAKGFITDRGKLMIRLFSHFYSDWDVYIIRNNADIDNLETAIKQKRYGKKSD